MPLSLRLEPRLAAHLAMTPQIRAALELLQLSHLEMAAHLRREVEANPLLEECEGGTGPEVDAVRPTGGERPAADEPCHDPRVPDTLAAHLGQQLVLGDLSPRERAVLRLVVEEVDEDGRLDATSLAEAAEAMGIRPAELAWAVGCVQGLDPAGVGARSLAECLLLQLERRPQSSALARAIARDHLAWAARGGAGALARALGAPPLAVTRALAELRALDPRPGRLIRRPREAAWVPDVVVRRQGGSLRVELNEAGLPRLAIHRGYRAALGELAGRDQIFVRERLRQASWLLRSIEMRRQSMRRVMASVVGFQAAFFERGPLHLRPLVLRQVAAEVGLHESTVCRVTANKVVDCDFGTYPLKYFFSPARGEGEVAAEAVRRHIARIVAAEDPRRPRSDGQIARLLGEADIDVARRTVAKYREMLKILPSSRRRRALLSEGM